MDRNGQIGHVEAHPFRPWQADQTTLLPPSPREWLAEEHQVYFLLGLVEELHPSEILVPDHAKDPRGEEGVAPL